ncbi:type II secretion system protein J [Colwellia sp. RSH04]|uniref:PulJ/GspJ family protein n=1 Tax=Colwellia sp. RSH04 TaxID=2305464 RepID=UPI000E57F224|nr:prepilin-type N-terminal cleavage/methylation domain-containing protein [Colwellia sp. RSH04]RHW74870.1 prepilin-type N-terminal cleavage/methylation domain-containing protein [Colwellia sp. RSH04]
MRRNSGFTLVEVMIASVILFAVITLLYQVVAQSSHSSDIATKNLEIHSVLPLITGKIKNNLTGEFEPKSLSGKGDLLEIEYHWTAKKIKSTPFVQSLSNEGTDLIGIAILWQIELELTSSSRTRLLTYQEVTW